MNPYVCDGNKDCYDLTFITRYQKDIPYEIDGRKYRKIRLGAIDATIKVSNPKSVNAKVTSVEYHQGSFKIGPVFTFPKIAEIVTAGDNRLLVTRVHRGKAYKRNRLKEPYSLVHDAKEDDINIVYSVYPEGAAQCDVTKWKKFHPISYAHADKANAMKDRYKFARYPFRDSLGKIVQPGTEFGGSYPWMDMHAANLFYTAFGADHFYNIYGRSVETPFKENDEDSDYESPGFMNFSNFSSFDAESKMFEVRGSETVGITIAGFWTHGKSVLLDGQLNNADYAFTIIDRERTNSDRVKTNREVQLYGRTPAGRKYEKIGAVRELGDAPLIPKEYNMHLTNNSTFMGSIENRLNYHHAAKPATPRDVVWLFGSTRHTEEVAFDDYMNPFMLINAEMTAPVGYIKDSHRMKHYDGIEKSRKQSNYFSGFPQVPLATPALIQNNSTAPDEFLTPPFYGKIHGNSRIEPIAKGGIHGKGLWLDKASGVTFSIPTQSKAKFNISKNKNWYMSLFVDPRGPIRKTELRSLVSFSDKSIALRKVQDDSYLFDRLVFRKGNTVVGFFHLPYNLRPTHKRWMNIGVSFLNNSYPQVYINGLYAGQARVSHDKYAHQLKNMISLHEGTQIVLGKNSVASTSGINGWLDEFKFLARNPTLEEKCNYSRGTLAKIDSKKNPYWLNIANSYPRKAHTDISNRIGKVGSSDKYVCFTRYYGGARVGDRMTYDHHANLKNMPVGFKSVREEVLQIKNTLVYGQPRPDFKKNNFCLSCHVSGHLNPNPELNLLALKRHDLAMQYDNRRQPMQSDKLIRGVIPANYFGRGMPSRTIASSKPAYVDQWLHPRLNSLAVSWNKGHSRHTYSFDIRYLDDDEIVTVAPCVDARNLKTRTSFVFNGTCLRGQKIPLNSETEIRVCSAKNNRWADGKSVSCSPYKKLLYREGRHISVSIKHK